MKNTSATFTTLGIGIPLYCKLSRIGVARGKKERSDATRRVPKIPSMIPCMAPYGGGVFVRSISKEVIKEDRMGVNRREDEGKEHGQENKRRQKGESRKRLKIKLKRHSPCNGSKLK